MLVMWAIIAVVFIVLEMATFAFVALYVAAGAFVAAIVALLGGNIVLQVAAFAVSGIVLLLLTRPVLMRKLQKGEVLSNVHWLVGKRGIVTIAIDNDAGTGQIRVGTEHWTARNLDAEASEPIPVDAKVDVISVEGVTAYVRM
jgi:membrane protein implicated in regulation of membrane protease activity